MTPAPGLLYRVGRPPDPLSLPPPDVPRNRGGRYDDPLGEYWTYYAAEQRVACFVEVLAQFRVDLTVLAALADLRPNTLDEPPPAAGIVPDDWHLKRVIARFSLAPGQRWLDLRRFETREHLRRELANKLVRLGYGDFDLGDALSRDRRLTQTISRWAYDSGYSGVAYTSRLDATFDCWAIFENAQLDPADVALINGADPDLLKRCGFCNCVGRDREPSRWPSAPKSHVRIRAERGHCF